MAIGIGAFTLWYTEELAEKIKAEEAKRIDLWAQATKSVNDPNTVDFTLALEIIKTNTSIPIILVDENDKIEKHRNLKNRDTSELGLYAELEKMKKYASPIEVGKKHIYRNETDILRKLRWYPRFLLGIIGLYILIAYFGFSQSRKGEQDRVWTGMARETAHQLGTPLTALYGWTALLEEKELAPGAVAEIKKDLKRLQTVADRFSKIGIEGKKELGNLVQILNQTVEYLKNRSSGSVKFQVHTPSSVPFIYMHPVLLGWVFENIIRNAIDAMMGEGKVSITVQELPKKLIIDFTDSGTGMTSRVKRSVFKPGFTTKTRGWGLGLSLSKRIIQEGHGGKLTVYRSAPGEGTTIRMELPI